MLCPVFADLFQSWNHQTWPHPQGTSSLIYLSETHHIWCLMGKSYNMAPPVIDSKVARHNYWLIMVLGVGTDAQTSNVQIMWRSWPKMGCSENQREHVWCILKFWTCQTVLGGSKMYPYDPLCMFFTCQVFKTVKGWPHSPNQCNYNSVFPHLAQICTNQVSYWVDQDSCAAHGVPSGNQTWQWKVPYNGGL